MYLVQMSRSDRVFLLIIGILVLNVSAALNVSKMIAHEQRSAGDYFYVFKDKATSKWRVEFYFGHLEPNIDNWLVLKDFFWV